MAKSKAVETEVEELIFEAEFSMPQADVLKARTGLILDMAGQGSGKTELIGHRSGFFASNFPKLKGFIAANTYLQLSQSTLNKVFKVWETYYGLTEYDAKSNPNGDYVVDKKPPGHFTKYEKFKNYNGIISFREGGLIFAGSLDNYLAHDGKEFAYAELDETKDTKKEALTTVILARLRQYGLWFERESGEVFFDDDISKEQAEENNWSSWNPCTIHTSPAEGGVDWLIELFELGDEEEVIRNAISDPDTYYFAEDKYLTVVIYQTYWNAHNLPPGYIDNRKARMSENEILKFIDGYPFSKSGGEYFPNFNRRDIVVRGLEHFPELADHLTFDFNVEPYLTNILTQVTTPVRWYDFDKKIKYYEPTEGAEQIEVIQIRFLKEYLMKSPLNSTEDAAQAYKDDITPGRNPDVLVYGDATGRARIVGLGTKTQYKLIEGVLWEYLSDGWQRVSKTNLANLKRRDFLNRIFEGKIPFVEILIDEDCKELIRDFEFVKIGVAGKHKEKAKNANGVLYEKIGHTSDAAEYLICEVAKQYLHDF